MIIVYCIVTFIHICNVYALHIVYAMLYGKANVIRNFEFSVFPFPM